MAEATKDAAPPLFIISKCQLPPLGTVGDIGNVPRGLVQGRNVFSAIASANIYQPSEFITHSLHFQTKSRLEWGRDVFHALKVARAGPRFPSHSVVVFFPFWRCLACYLKKPTKLLVLHGVLHSFSFTCKEAFTCVEQHRKS